jgi:hypothetical protein
MTEKVKRDTVDVTNQINSHLETREIEKSALKKILEQLKKDLDK